VSYTVNTLEALNAREPGTAWILVMGSDRAADFIGWRSSDRILKMASISVAARPGVQTADGLKNTAKVTDGPGLSDVLTSRVRYEWSGKPGEVILLPGTDLDLASSQIRGRLTVGEEPIGLCEQVKRVIVKEKLYR